MEAGAPPGARHWRPSSRASRNLCVAAGPLGLGSAAGEPAAGGVGAPAACDALHAALVRKLQPLAAGVCPGGPLASACGVEPGSRDSSRSDLSADARRAGWWLGEGPDSPGGAGVGCAGGSRGLMSSTVGLACSANPAAAALDAIGTPRTPSDRAGCSAPGADSVTPPGLPPGESLVTPPRGGATAALRGVRRQLVQSFSDDDHLGVFDVPSSPGDSPARPSPPGAPGAWAWPAGKGDGGPASPARAASAGSPGSTGSPPSDGASCTGRSEYATPGARGATTPGRGASWRPPRPPSTAALRAFHGSKASLLAAAAAHKTPTSVLDLRPSPPSGASSDGGHLYDVALSTPPRGAVAPAVPMPAPAPMPVVLRPRSATSASRGCSVLGSLGLACGVRERAEPPKRSPPQPPPRAAPLPLQYVIPPAPAGQPLTASPAPRRWGAPGWGEEDAAAAARATAAAAAARDGATPPGARRPLAPRQAGPPLAQQKPPKMRLCSVFG